MDHSLAASKGEDPHEDQMEAIAKVGAGACKNEQKEDAPAMAASSSPTHSSAEDIFSDTMELANYLHRRVQEIGKQFRRRPFRIHTNERLESALEFVQDPASEASLASAMARACEPEELAVANGNADNCLREGEGGLSLAEMKPSSASCFSKGDWTTVHAETKHNEGSFNTERKVYHLYGSRPGDGRACNIEELALAHREENFPFSSESTDNTAQREGEAAPSKRGEEKLLTRSEIAEASMRGKHQAHNQGSGMGSTSPMHANLAGFQEAVNSNTYLDAGSCPALRHADGKNPRSQCSIPLYDSSEHRLCHASSDIDAIPAHLLPDVKLPFLQDHGMSDVEDVEGFSRGVHTEIVHSQTIAESCSPLHLNVQHSMSSVDSSECDNCGIEENKRGDTFSRAGNGADGNKSEEIDAMSEAKLPDTHRKEEEDGTLAKLGGEASGRAEAENDAFDLLLDAIQVTSAEVVAAKEGAEANQKGACQSERLGHGSIQTMHTRDSPELPTDTPRLHVRSFPIVKKRSDRSARMLAGKGLSRSSASPAVRFKSLQAVSEVDLSKDRKGNKKHAANKPDDQKAEGSKTSDSLQGHSKGKRERTWESQQDTLAENDRFGNQEKREKISARDVAHEGTGRKEQLPAMPASEGEKQEHGMLARRARLQVLPTKFLDSVLQPWKKGDRRRS